ncbi:MAG: 3-isopropylmalate dehydratase small subunit [Acetobacteraceae bacterium]|nr:3-isopropylmalate dehydratase small subunit [Acetobacteraceae bacterium]
MDRFTQVTGPAIPLMAANVDTDVIIPIQDLVGTGRSGLGPRCFGRVRYRADGSENPDFIANREPYRGSPILLAAENFGCGSSREGAVWALMGMGVRAVIAPSFGDIFFANCFQNGLLPVRLPIEEVRRLAEETEASPGNARTTVDLERKVVVTPAGREIPFAVDDRKRQAMLEGLDDISLTLKRGPEIEAWKAKDRASRAWAWESVS